MKASERLALETTVKKSFNSYYDKSCETVLSEHLKDPKRVYFLRPSTFPYCATQRFMDYPEALEAKGLTHMDASMLFYVTVGHAFHAVFQEILGKNGKLIGDWRCPKCKSTKTFSLYSRCKACDVPRQYRELEVKYKKTLVGHIDGLYWDDATKTYWVIDYKSTSSRQIWWHAKKKSVFPYRDNVAQIKAYVPLLELEFDIKIAGYMLVYLPRDNPFKGKITCIKALSRKAKDKITETLDNWVKDHRKLLNASTIDDFKALYARKLCSSLEDYKDNYHSQYNPCAHHTYCFNQKKMLANAEKVIAKCKDDLPILRHAPERIMLELHLPMKTTKT